MTKQERAFELYKRGYKIDDIASIVGWHKDAAKSFFQSEEIQLLAKQDIAEEINAATDHNSRDELDNLDDKLSAVEHAALNRLRDCVHLGTLNDVRRVVETIGHRRTELSKQTGNHKGSQETNGKVVAIVINTAVAERLKRNSANQISSVAGRELKTLDREKVRLLIDNDSGKVDVLDEIEQTL